MGFTDLKLLFNRENRIYLILIIWLLVGFTIAQFSSEITIGIALIILFPLIVGTFIFLLIAFFSKKRLHELSKKRIILSFIICLIFIVPLFYIGYILFWIGIFSFIIITSIFTMYYFFELGVAFDSKLQGEMRSRHKVLRLWIFLGGLIGAIIILVVTIMVTEAVTGGTQQAIGFNTAVFAIFMIFIIIFFSILGLIGMKGGKLHAWMGIFYVWVAIYTVYLIISIIYKMSSTDGGLTSIEIQILLYFFNLLLLLNTIGGLIGKKAEIIREKLKIFGPDTILLWLIFSMAGYQFAINIIENAIVIKYAIVYALFVPLMIIMSWYGIIFYRKLIIGKQTSKQEPQVDEIKDF